MATYAEASLGPNEKIVRQGKLHWLIYFWPAFWTLVTFGFAAIITVPWVLLALIRQLTTDLVITDRRLIHKTGLISRNTLELRLNKIESVNITQGILGRIFNCGAVTVTGSGMAMSVFRQLDQPLEFKRYIEAAIEEAQRVKAAA
jgi:uncharacterized membrane protein YdbT with pleckstrin-like domain